MSASMAMAPEDSAVAGAEPPNKSKPQPAIKRQNGSFVHVHEQRALQWLVRRLPQWVTSDMLTLFGVLGSIMTGLGWYWALDNRLWLLMGNLGLFIHWYGDSLDGLAARHRDLSRPSYGFFVDIMADVASAAFWMAGAAAGPISGQYFWVPVGVVLPLFLMIVMLDLFNVALAPKHEHNIDAAGVSGTEARMVLAVFNFVVMGLDDEAAATAMQITLVAFAAFGAIFVTVRSIVFGRMLRAIDDARLAERQAARGAAAVLTKVAGGGDHVTGTPDSGTPSSAPHESPAADASERRAASAAAPVA